MELRTGSGGSETALGALDGDAPVRAAADPIAAYAAEHLWTGPPRPASVLPDRSDLSVPRGRPVPAAVNHPRRSARVNR